VRSRAPNEILQIPRDASPAEIVAAVTARTAHFRELSADESVQALSEIYQAAAFLLWEIKTNPEARTTPGAAAGAKPSRHRRVPAKPRRKRRRKAAPGWAPLLIVAPTLAALAVFLLYPDDTMSAAWKLVDQAAAARALLSDPPEPTPPALPTPTLPVIPTAGAAVVAPAAISHSEPAATPGPAPTPDAPAQTATLKPVRACVTISSLNVRAGPGVAYPSNSYLLEGECVTVVAQNAAGTWGLVRSAPRAGAESGWTSLAYLQSDKSLRTLPVATPPAVPSPSP
jgi:hypothetical protein